MNTFIERNFENIKTNEIEVFSNITKIHIQMPQGGTGFKKQHQSTISVILGEPASGKTYQLIEEDKTNDKSYFVELINLKDDDIIAENIDIVLLDSIDEALTDYDNPKKLQDKLTNFIKRCHEINPQVKFVISCRFLEWSKHFEDSLKKIDEELRVYKVLPLSEEDINTLLVKNNIQHEDFWNFIDENYLEELLKNILITLHLIESFSTYKTKKVTFIDIYNDIVKKYLSQKGEDRQEETTDMPLDELLMIASSLAIYMSLNRVADIAITNLSMLANELYIVDGKQIVENDLRQILTRGLFDKKDGKLVFFHNTVQEYLVAYFIAKKNLSVEIIKTLFTSKLRCYEEFEEVIVYLTNLKPELFDEFVEFDPFIFKRHPNLTKEQQAKLLLSILNKINSSQMWGRWESFEGSTLVRFEKLDNLIEILQENITLKEHGYYLMKLVDNNYTYKFQEYIFKFFEKNLSDKETIIKVIRESFIDNYEFNLSLLKFLKKHNLLEKDIHSFMMSFESELFSSLYGIKYKYKYGGDRIIERTDINFHTIVPLLDFVPATSLKYIAPYLLKIDTREWFQYVVDKYVDNRYNYEFMGWVLHAVLKHCDSVDSLIKIARNVQEKEIYLHSIDKEDINLDFKVIEDIFWEVYFETDVLQDYRAREIVSLYDITLDDIKIAIDKYPIETYIEKYVYFRLLGDDVDKFLMLNEDFNVYMLNEWKRQEEREKEWGRERKEKYPDTVKQKEDERLFYIKCLDRFGTKEEKSTDYHNIFISTFNKQHNKVIEIDKLLQENLSEKYTEYILKVKHKFKVDILYKNIKNDLLSSELYYDTIIYNYLFEVLDEDELKQMVKTKKDYIKLFWHVYKKSFNSFSDKFIKLSENYFNCFVLLSLHSLQISVKQSESEKIGHFNLFINAFKELNKFDKDFMKPIINYLIKDKSIIPKLKKFYEKEYLLELLALDRNNYLYILELMSYDDTNMYIYLQYLLKIDTNKGLEDFYKIYEKEKRYKPIWTRFILRLKNKKETGYDNQIINPKKIELLQVLIKSIKSNNKEVNSKYLKFILKDYYEFFLEYHTPKGTFSPDIYDDMHRVINNIWSSLESSTQHINILEELAQDKNEKLANFSKYALTKSYEQQEKDRNYSNSYYKEIFDKEEKMDKNAININGDRNNIAINSKNIKQKTSIQSNDKDDMWWIYSVITGLATTLIIWWSYGSWYYAIPGGIVSSFIVWKLNPKFRFRNIGYALLTSGVLSNIISFSGAITIPKNDLIYGIVKFGDNNVSIFLIVLSTPFFILDFFENKK